MEWYLATKIAVQSIFDKKTRNIVIGIILFLVFSLLALISIPTMIVALPQTVFMDEETSKDINDRYIEILVDYKYRIHDRVRVYKSTQMSMDREINDIEINYPSLSLVIAYDNAVNKKKYLNSNISPSDLNKDEIFSFLDRCMSYNLVNKTLVVKVKTSDEIAKSFKTDEEKIIFNTVYETMKSSDIDSTVPDVQFSEFDYLEGGISLPYLSQRDNKWAYKPYGDSTIIESGCGIASMSMILNGLIPELNLLPPELAKWSYENGHYVSGVGTAWSLMPSLASKYGLKMKNLSRDNPQAILNELSKGNPVLVSMSAGHFTTGGHFMVLRGVTKDGKILISDPWNYEYSQIPWDFSIILTESSTLSPSCFWSFSLQ